MCAVCVEILDRYKTRYDGEIQGCCLVIAEEIATRIGGEVVAGFLRWTSCRKSHWWVATPDGQIHDPMGEEYRDEPGFHREEIHRSRAEFKAILPRYERWRVD